MSDVRIRYLVDLVDRGTTRLLAQDRKVQSSLTATDRLSKKLADSSSAAGRAQTAAASEAAAAAARQSKATEGVTAATRAHGTQAKVTASAVESYARAQEVALRAGAGLERAALAEADALKVKARAAAAAARATDAAAAADRRQGRTAGAVAAENAGAGARRAGTAAPRAAGGGGGSHMVGGAATAGLFGLAVAAKQAVDFDKEMRNVNSIAQLGEGRFNALSKSVLALAGPTAQAPKTLASGLYDLVSSGFKGQGALTVLTASAKAATAGLTDTKTSAAAVSAVLNAYHEPAAQASKVSDTLFQTVNRGVINFEDLATTIGDVLPFAASLGVGLDQVGASISTMTKEGISAPETMTRIKQVMESFIKPSKGMAKALKATGAESGEALVKQKGFQGALEAVIGTTDKSKASVAKLFPNIRALGGALALTGGNARSAHGDLKAFGDVTGATDKALSQQSKSVSYQWQKLKAEASALGISVGSKLIPQISALVGHLAVLAASKDGMSKVKRELDVLVGAGKNIVTALTPLGKLALGLVKGFSALPKPLQAAAVTFGALAVASRALAGSAAVGALTRGFRNLRGELIAVRAIAKGTQVELAAVAGEGAVVGGAAGAGAVGAGRSRAGAMRTLAAGYYRGRNTVAGDGFTMVSPGAGSRLAGVRAGVGDVVRAGAGRGALIAAGAGTAGAIMSGGSVLGGVASGAAMGAMAGPWGAAIGAAAGGIGTELVNVFKGASERRARDAAKAYANRLTEGTQRGLAAGMNSHAAQQAGAAEARLRSATDRVAQVSGRRLPTVSGGRAGGITPNAAAALTRTQQVDIAKALAAQRSAGDQLGRALAQGYRSGARYLDPGVILRDFDRSFSGASPAAKKAGAQRVLDFALEAQRQGRISKRDVERIAASLGTAFGAKIGPAGSAGARRFVDNAARELGDRKLVNAMNAAARGLQTDAKHGFAGLPQIAAHSLAGAASVLRDQMDWMRNKVRTSTGKQRDDAKAALASLEKNYERVMAHLSQTLGTGASDAVSKFDRIRQMAHNVGVSFDEARRRIDGAAASIKDFPKFPDPLGPLSTVPRPKTPSEKHPAKPNASLPPAFKPLGHHRGGGWVRRYQDGGLVPIVASGGEVLVHGGQSYMIGGPDNRDATPLLAPAGSAVLTYSGQALMSAGATLNQALAAQAPHFAKGGTVGPKTIAAYGRRGGFSGAGLVDAVAVALAESGGNLKAISPTGDYGLWQINRAAHPRYFKSPGRIFDPTYNAHAAYEISGGGRNWAPWTTWRSGAARRLLSRARAAVAGSRGLTAGSGTGAKDSTLSVPIMLGRSRSRAGLVSDAFSQGVSAGESGLTRAEVVAALHGARGAQPSPIMEAIAGAQAATRRQVTVPGVGRSDTSSKAGKLPSGVYVPSGTWNPLRKPIARWIVPYLSYGSSHGWRGTVTSGYRDPRVKVTPGPGLPVAPQGKSNHNLASYPGGAVDVTQAAALSAALAKKPGAHLLRWAGSKDPVHFSHPHNGTYRLGGIVRRYRSGGLIPHGMPSASASGGVGGAIGGQLGSKLTSAMSFKGGTYDALNVAIMGAAEARIEQLRRAVAAAVQKGGDAKVVQRLRGVLDMVDFELGRRLGRIRDTIAQRTTNLGRAITASGQTRRVAGVADDSAAGLADQAQFSQAVAMPALQANVRSAQSIVRRAKNSGSTEQIRQAAQDLADAQDALSEEVVSQVERWRDIIRAKAQERVDTASFGVDAAQNTIAGVDVSQRLSHTADTAAGMTEKAGAISATLVPALAAQRDAFANQFTQLTSIGDVAGARQAYLAAQQAANDLGSAMADAADLVRQAATQMAQDAVDAATHRSTMANAGLQHLDLEQQLIGTHDTSAGGEGRAQYIKANIIPALQKEVTALQGQQRTAISQGDQKLADQIAEAIAGKQNDILQAQLDAQEAIKANTADLPEFAGTVGYEYQGSQFTDSVFRGGA